MSFRLFCFGSSTYSVQMSLRNGEIWEDFGMYTGIPGSLGGYEDMRGYLRIRSGIIN